MMSRPASNQQLAPGQGRSHPERITPYLTHLVTHHGQLTLVPPQNAGRIRKGGKKNPERPRERRRETDEPRFNTAAPAAPRTASRRGNTVSGRAARVPVPPPNLPRDSTIPDYPPPSFQEAIMSPPYVPPPVAAPPIGQPQSAAGPDPVPNTSSPPPADDRRTLSPGGPSQPPSLTVQTAIGPSVSPAVSPASQQTGPHSGSSGSDEGSTNSSSLEIVDLESINEGIGSDSRRQAGQSPDFEGRSDEQRPNGERGANASSRQHISGSCYDPSHHVFDPAKGDRCTHCGSPASPSIKDHPLPPLSSPDLTEDEPDDISPPSSPKSKKGWKKVFAPLTIREPHSIPSSPLSPTPKSPTSAFGMLHSAWESTLTLASSKGSPSKSTATPSPPSLKGKSSVGVRRLFASRGKERECHPVKEDSDEEPWEVVNRASILFQQEQEQEAASRPGSPRGMVKQDLDGTWHNVPGPSSRGPYNTTPFLNRSLRHPTMSGSTLTLPFNQSMASLHQGVAGSVVSYASPASDPGVQRKPRRPPPPPPPRRKVASNAPKPSPSAIHLASFGSDGVGSSFEHPATSSATLPVPTHNSPPSAPRSYPSLPSLRPSPREDEDPSPALPSAPAVMRYPVPFQPPALSPPRHAELPPVSTIIQNFPPVPVLQHTPATPIFPPPAAMATTDSVSTVSMDSPPSTPTTPTHHYHGRPLPMPPLYPSPLRRAAVIAPTASGPEVLQASEYTQYTDLDVLASRVIEDDHSGQNYEDLLRISEFAGPAPRHDNPFALGADTLKVPPSGRVQLQRRRAMKDGRVKLKLTLMGVAVDKCGICLSQFKDADVACLGTHCEHAFHEYCLKRWLVRSRTCPFCRKLICA